MDVAGDVSLNAGVSWDIATDVLMVGSFDHSCQAPPHGGDG